MPPKKSSDNNNNNNKYPVPAATKTPKVEAKVGADGKPVKSGKRKFRRKQTYATYIYKVLKQVHPDTGLSKKAMSTANSIINDLHVRIIEEAVHICTANRNKGISVRHIVSAVKILFPDELASHAKSEGVKAVTKYQSSLPKVAHKSHSGPPGGLGGKGKGKGKRSGVPTKTMSFRAGLQFPVGRTRRLIKQLTRMRVGAKAAIYLAAVEEYLTAEILELSGNAARDYKRKRITPRCIQLAIRNDEELNKLIPGTIASGGVIPNIHASLLPKKRKLNEDVDSNSSSPQKKTTGKYEGDYMDEIDD